MKIKEFKLERYFAQYEFRAPYLLSSSDCESFITAELFRMEDKWEKDFRNLWLGYTESLGSPLLRKEIARLYTDCKPDHVLVFAGAEEGIFVFMNVLLEMGDNIIVQTPCYQSLYEVARYLQCSVTQWPMNPGKNWELDIDFLKDHITPNTKAIVINCPNNPTGYTIARETLEEIVEIARAHNIYLFSDEVYRFLEYREEDRLPAACDIYDKGVSLGVMSKAFGLAGLRIGWITTRKQWLFERMASFKDYTSICNSAPSEFLATLALRYHHVILERNRNIIFANLRRLESFFDEYSKFFLWNKPKAGPLAFPRLLFTDDADGFCHDLMEKEGVLLAPGQYFGSFAGHVRFGFGRKNMPEALERLERYLATSLKPLKRTVG